MSLSFSTAFPIFHRLVFQIPQMNVLYPYFRRPIHTALSNLLLHHHHYHHHSQYHEARRFMAGHSHFHNIRHKKAAVDAKRSTFFSRLSREVYAAIASGGSDVSTNERLQRALAAARRANMPKTVLDRALQRARNNVSNQEPAIYDAIMSQGVAVRVRAHAAIRPRGVSAELRALIKRAGGDFGKAAHLFEDRYTVVVVIVDEQQKDVDDIENNRNNIILMAMDCNALDFQVQHDDDKHTLLHFFCASLKQRDELANKLKKEILNDNHKIYTVRSVEPVLTVEPKDEKHLEKLQRLFEALDEHPDVVEVIHNVNI